LRFHEAVLGGESMSQLETNIFQITNLRELRTTYRLYHIRGLSLDQEEYDPNIQTLIRKFSFSMRSPVTILVQNGEPHLVVPEGTPEPTSPYPLVRATAYFDKTDKSFVLDYENPTTETDALRSRFLQFAIEGALFSNRALWQPSAGNPFFERNPALEKNGICVYRGFAVRVVSIEGNKLGICVDAQHKYVSSRPLSSTLKREDFRPFKNARCIYHYGNSWYEIKLHDHTGLSVSEQMISVGTEKPVTLLQYIMDNAQKPLPREIADLPATSPTVSYMTGRDEVRYAAAPVCYPVFDTSDPRIKTTHQETVLGPQVRRESIQSFVKNNLAGIRFKDMCIRISTVPALVSKHVFLVPDLAFGNNTIYSTRNTPGATAVTIEQVGRTRMAALFNTAIGPYVNKPLDRQYVILPRSTWDSHGPAFLKDLKAVVGNLFQQELPYNPIPIIYNDLGPKTYVSQGRAILEAVNSELREPGYGIVMVHETVDRKNREHDQLASMVMRELRDRDLFVSVIHSKVAKECYQLPPNAPAGTEYQPVSTLRGKLNGYLRNVAITKILLTNERWPFVLATPLHADLTIAIDVQLHTAGFAFVGKSGPDIRTVLRTSNQKERLSKAQVRQTIVEVLRQEVTLGRQVVKTIVVQRDGRLFAGEIAGIKEAAVLLKAEGLLPADVSLNFIEIPKKSAAPFRLFDVNSLNGREVTSNPQIGSYYVPTNRDGYICTTGKEFFHPGTVNPLHVKYVQGTMPFSDILEDVYSLTCLAWTRPEDCTRHPITLKLVDIRLTEHAGGYDEDALAFDDQPEGEDDSDE
jgi:hypothetical protein